MKPQTARKCGLGLGVFGIVLIAVAFVVSWYVNHTISNDIAQGVQIRQPSDDLTAFNEWQNTKNAKDRKIWKVSFFDWTNIDEVMKSSTPVVPVFEEKGPYVYQEFENKFNVTFDANGLPPSTVSFNDAYSYEFLRNESYGDETDLITGPWLTWQAAIEAQHLTATPAIFAFGFARDILIGYNQTCFTFCMQLLNNATTCQNYGLLQFSKLSIGQSVTQFAPIMGELQTSANFTEQGLFGFFQTLASRGAFPEFKAYAQDTLKNSTLTLTPEETEYLFIEKGLLTNQLAAYALAEFCTASFPLLSPKCPYLSQWISDLAYALTRAGTTRSIREILFDYKDPFSLFVNAQEKASGAVPPPINTAYFPTNFTPAQQWQHDVESGFPNNAVSVQNTGASHADQASTWEFWEGFDVLPARANGSLANPGFFCGGDSPISGRDDSQPGEPAEFGILSYSPKVTESSMLTVWVDNVYRDVAFQFKEHVTVKGIDLMRFSISPSSSMANPQFDCFYDGLINLTCASGGQPVVLTQAHWYQADVPAPFNEVMPLSINQSTEDDATYLDVDPITGATLRGLERLQVNVMLNKTNNFASFPIEKLIPVLWIEEYVVLTDDQAHQYKSNLLGAIKLRQYLFFSLVGVGLLSVAIGLFLWCFKGKETHDREPINKRNQVDYHAMKHPETEEEFSI